MIESAKAQPENDFIVSEGVQALFRYKYLNRRARETIANLSSASGILVEGSVLRNLREQGFDLQLWRDNKSAYSPQDMFNCLDRYTHISVCVPDQSIWNQAMDVTLRQFDPKGAELLPLISDEDLMAAIKFEKSAGAPEFTQKGEAVIRDLRRMKRWLNEEKKSLEPCVAYHRVQHGDEGPKNRLVWGYPLSVTLAEAMFARPLIDHFRGTVTPMAFAVHRHALASRMVCIENMSFRYGFDFKGFDASIHPKLIDMAFGVLLRFFKSGTVNSDHWHKVVKYFIHTPILMPDGNVYQKHKGVPSGSYFTQLVDSVINFFVIQYAHIYLAGMAIDKGKLYVLGDDSLFGSPRLLSLRDFQKVFNTLGVTLNTQSGVWKEGEDVHFLGHSWHYGVVDRTAQEIAMRMAFPEKHSKIEDPRLRILSRVVPYVTDARSAHVIIKNWSRCKVDIPSIYSRAGPLDKTGWQEFQSMFEEGDPALVNALVQAYVGILK